MKNLKISISASMYFLFSALKTPHISKVLFNPPSQKTLLFNPPNDSQSFTYAADQMGPLVHLVMQNVVTN